MSDDDLILNRIAEERQREAKELKAQRLPKSRRKRRQVYERLAVAYAKAALASADAGWGSLTSEERLKAQDIIDRSGR